MKFFSFASEDIQIVEGQVNVPAIIEELSNTMPTDEPFYVMNIDEVVRKHQRWIEKMPRVVPHYAVKCNDSEVVCSTLAALGAGFDCASKGEISKILGLGIAPERIIFANPMKPSSHLRYASSNNVKTMTFDSDTELYKIKKFCPDAKLVLRIRCDDEEAACPLGKKFGCDPVEEAPRLIEIVRDLNMDLVGISFHVGSGCTNFPVYYKAISYARDLFDYAATVGFELNLLDIGGGFPGDYGTSIDEVSIYVNSALDKFFPDKSVRVISEPGRYYVTSAFTLLACVQSKRVCVNAKTGAIDRIMYYLNDGIYASFNCINNDSHVPMPKLVKQYGGKMYDSTIWGPTCDSLDLLIDTIQLPELQIDDWLVYVNMGAYTIPLATSFNGFPLPKVYYYISEDTLKMFNIFPLEEEIFSLPTNNEIAICA